MSNSIIKSDVFSSLSTHSADIQILENPRKTKWLSQRTRRRAEAADQRRAAKKTNKKGAA